jgi:hypothetical protein
MKFKKFILTIIILIIIYYITQIIVNTYSQIEKYKNIDGILTEDNLAPYSKACKNKLDSDPNYFNKSLIYDQKMFTLNDDINKYYKNLSKDLGNIPEAGKASASNARLWNNSDNIKELASTCNPAKVAILKTETNKLIEFKKINSINTEIEFNNIEDYYAEYSNEYFNNEFDKMSSKVYISTLNSVNKTQNIDENLLEIYLKIENKFLKDLNLIDRLVAKSEFASLTNNRFCERSELCKAYSASKDFQIIQRFINYFFVNTENNIYYVDIDLLIYRENKQHGKHVNIIATLTSAKKVDLQSKELVIDLINIRVIGIVIDSVIKLYQGDTILNNFTNCKSKCKNMIKNNLITEEIKLSNLTDIEIEKYLENHEKELSERF